MIICSAGVVRIRIKDRGVCWDAEPESGGQTSQVELPSPNLTIADPHDWPRRSLSSPINQSHAKLASTVHDAKLPIDPVIRRRRRNITAPIGITGAGMTRLMLWVMTDDSDEV